MDIEKMIEKIAEEIYEKVSSGVENTNSKSKSIASMIDHTLLKQNASVDQIKKVCEEAREYKFASVCVNPSYVPLVAHMLKGSGVKTCCVVGFPLGATSTKAKVEETKDVIENGAQEVDMVINVGAIKSGDWNYVQKDIEAVVMASKGKALVKVIIETCLLTDEEKVKACTASKEAGADFVKTSTGFSTGGATVEDIRLMRETVGPDMGVKASGGVKDYKSAVDMINAGATRVGTSSGISIVKSEVIGETTPKTSTSSGALGLGIVENEPKIDKKGLY